MCPFWFNIWSIENEEDSSYFSGIFPINTSFGKP